MKVICQGNELSDALSKVVKALPVKRTNPILDGIKLSAEGDTLTIFATDLELSIEKKINAKVLIEGQVVVPGKLFSEYAKKIEKEEVELDGTNETKLFIKYLDSSLWINCFNADEYPVIKDVNKDTSFIILKKDFKDIVNKIVFNVAVDEARPALRGVCFNIKDENIEAVASDGYRLAFSKATIQNNGFLGKIVVPAKSINELIHLLDDEDNSVNVYIENNFLMVDLFHTKITTRLIAEDYINYERVIPTAFTSEATVDKVLFEEALDRVSLMNKSEKNGYVKMEVKEEALVLSSKSESGEINEKLNISLKGKDLVIGFNAKYIIEFMHAVADEFVTFNFTTSTSPTVIKGETDRWLFLALPVRVIG